MKLENVVEICVALDVALVGLGYPIILDKVSRLGAEYEADELKGVFNSERVRPKLGKVPTERFLAVVTLISLLFLVIQSEPWSMFDDSEYWIQWFVGNSAKLLVVITSIFFVGYMVNWLHAVIKYSGHLTELVKLMQNHLTRIEEQLAAAKQKSNENEKKTIETLEERRQRVLDVLNQLSIHAINTQHEKAQRELSNLFHNLTQRKFDNLEIGNEFEHDLAVKKLHIKVFSSLDKLESINSHLLNQIISGQILLPSNIRNEYYLSRTSYQLLWALLRNIAKRPEYVKMFWSHAYQFKSFNFRLRQDFYESTDHRTYLEELYKREADFNQILFAFGGLLFYLGEWDSMRYIINYSSSNIEMNVIFKDSINQTINFDFKHREVHRDGLGELEYFYAYPGIDNFGNYRSYYINYYAFIFYMISQRRIASGQPEEGPLFNVESLNNINDCSSRQDYLSTLRFYIAEIQKEYKEFREDKMLESVLNDTLVIISTTETMLEERVSHLDNNGQLDADLMSDLKEQPKQIIKESLLSGLGKWNKVRVPKQEETKVDFPMQKATFNRRSLMPESGITHLNAADYLAKETTRFAWSWIKTFINNLSSRRYLVFVSDLNAGISRLINKKNSEDYIIVTFNLRQEYCDVLKNSKLKHLRCITNADYQNNREVHVLAKKDIPLILSKSNNQPITIEDTVVTVEESNGHIVQTIDLGMTYSYDRNSGTGVTLIVEDQAFEEGIVKELWEIEPIT